MVEITINGRTVEAEPGRRLLEVIKEQGITISNLCYIDGLEPYAGCRTCMVEVEGARPTPQQVRSEVWMAIVHGATGIIYFCHEFTPREIEAGLLQYPEIMEAVKQVNAEVTGLAPVIHSPTVADAVDVTGDVATLCKRHGGATYVFAVSRAAQSARASFSVRDVPAGATVEVLGEGRRLTPESGRFEDDFPGYAVRLYRISR